LVVQDIIASGDRAVVELKAIDVECKNGLAFTNEYAWILKFNDQNKIIKVNAYMDT
jgi:ketosteroid isomerase-like protein